jgi:hypothetical protein
MASEEVILVEIELLRVAFAINSFSHKVVSQHMCAWMQQQLKISAKERLN